jgi:C-terminal processing protease CtpA/Prc
MTIACGGQGDELLSVDGLAIDGLETSRVTELIRGPAASTVRLATRRLMC